MSYYFLLNVVSWPNPADIRTVLGERQRKAKRRGECDEDAAMDVWCHEER